MTTEPTSDEPVPAVPAEAPRADPVTPAAAAPQPTPAETAQQLRKLFPGLFGGGAKPLKLRIQADIQERAPGVFTKQALSAFLRRHTGSTSYLIALSKARERFDLDGAPAGELAAEHRDAAIAELARRRENQVSREELERQQRFNRAGLLRDFQTTTLTPANFCALKGVAVDELDGLLAIARREAEEDRANRAQPARPPTPPRPNARAEPRNEPGNEARHDPRSQPRPSGQRQPRSSHAPRQGGGPKPR